MEMKICTKCGSEFCYESRKDNRTHWCLDCTRAYNRQAKKAVYVRKTSGTAQERSGVIHTFFDNWTSDSAYALGLLFTDGCVQKRSNWSINFVNTEYSLVEWVHSILKSNRKITKSLWATKKNPTYLPMYSTGVTSSHMGDRLISLGVIPRKSKIPCSLPIVPKEFQLDFLRGLIDGDGSVLLMKGKKCVGGKTLRVSFVDAWDDVCIAFQDILKGFGVQSSFMPKRRRSLKGGSAERISSVLVGGEQAELLCSLLYASEKICHPKKYNVWKEYVAMRVANGGLISTYVQRRRTTPQYPWLPLLGTMDDRQLSKIAGMSFSRIGQLRAERGIPCYVPNERPIKVKPWHTLVGTMLDSQVSEQTGISTASVCLYRKRMDIPRFKGRSKHKSPLWLSLAGTVPDPQLAKIVGLSSGRVAAIRSNHGIPSYRTSMKKAA
jgi:hypothetical protein